MNKKKNPRELVAYLPTPNESVIHTNSHDHPPFAIDIPLYKF